MASPSVAANAYSSLARLGDSVGLSKGPGEASSGPNFGTLLKDAVAGLGNVSRKSDAQATALATGKANIVDVVTAVAETEVAIDTLVSVRDRVIHSYEEIMKMPI
jgi:flagellar hook-basal body complex protein FliE